MTKKINLEGLEASAAIIKPTVVGAAFKIFMLGGSKLTDKQAGQAAGSPYLWRENKEDIRAFVEELEGRLI